MEEPDRKDRFPGLKKAVDHVSECISKYIRKSFYGKHAECGRLFCRDLCLSEGMLWLFCGHIPMEHLVNSNGSRYRRYGHSLAEDSLGSMDAS